MMNLEERRQHVLAYRNRRKYYKTHTEVSDGVGWLRNERLLPKVIETLRFKWETIRRAYFNAYWEPWWNKVKAQKLTKFWGYHTHNDTKYVIFNGEIFGDEGFSHDFLSDNCNDYEKLYRILPIEELPLHINDPMGDEAKRIYRGRCDGSIQPYPHRQDLVDEYYRVDKRCERLNGILYKCNKVLEGCIFSKYSYRLYKKPHAVETLPIQVTINGRAYLYLLEAHAHKNIKLLVGPEDTITKETIK